MPTIDQFLSTLLVDVARARVTADEVSRNLADAYRRDPILKAFPVPRVTIREFTVDLAFAVDKVTVEEGGRGVPTLDARIDSLLRQLASEFIPAALDTVLEQQVRVGAQPVALAALFGRKTADLRKDLTVDAAEFLAQDRGQLDAPATKDRIAKALADRLVEAARSAGATVNAAAATAIKSQAERVAGDLLAKAAEAAERARQEPITVPRVEVLVTKQDLDGLPDTAVSRLRLTLSVEDHEWIETERDGRSARLIER